MSHISAPDARGLTMGPFSDICRTAEISSCRQKITAVRIPTVDAPGDASGVLQTQDKKTVSYRLVKG